jgi:hypothetical protein
MDLEAKHNRAIRSEIGERLATMLPPRQPTLPDDLRRAVDKLAVQDDPSCEKSLAIEPN